MICLQCGRCCSYPVGVVRPEYAETFSVDNDNAEYMEKAVYFKNDGEICPNLNWKSDGKAFCNIHNKPWFPNTPCGRHTQVESSPTDVCRLGKYLIDNKVNIKEQYFKK